MIARAAAHNPHIQCLSFSGCALSPKCVIDLIQALKEGPEHSIQFLDLARNYMDSHCVDEIINLLADPDNLIQRIDLDSLSSYCCLTASDICRLYHSCFVAHRLFAEI